MADFCACGGNSPRNRRARRCNRAQSAIVIDLEGREHSQGFLVLSTPTLIAAVSAAAPSDPDRRRLVLGAAIGFDDDAGGVNGGHDTDGGGGDCIGAWT